MKIVDLETIGKCRVYLRGDERIPSVTLRSDGGVFRSWSLKGMQIPLLKAWPKVTWVAVDRAVMSAHKNNQPMPEKMLERLGMEVVYQQDGTPIPVLSAYLEYFWNETTNDWGPPKPSFDYRIDDGHVEAVCVNGVWRKPNLEESKLVRVYEHHQIMKKYELV